MDGARLVTAPRPVGATADARVGIVLPARDAARWIDHALASLEVQTFGDFEILVIDDHSTDSTATRVAARAAADPRIRLLPNRGRGLVAALSTGIAATRAPLIARMDADDVARPERLARQMAYLDAHPRVALVGAQAQPIDAAGRELGPPSRFPTEPDLLAHALQHRGCTIRHPTVLMRREALEAVGGYRAVTEWAEDYDLWLRMAERFRLANLPDVLLDYRLHPDQVSHGLNWRQRFARDAALVAARARRRGEADPLAGFAAPFDLDDTALARDPRLTPDLRRLAAAYASARAVTQARYGAVEPDFAAMLEAARAGFFGEGRAVRASILRHCARAAWSGGQPLRAVESFVAALRISPGRALRPAA